MPSVSIILINHNYSHFLRAAIDSALDQIAAAEQVIVVDDGSEDGSLAIIASYGDRIIPVIKSAGGHVSAVNAGYQVSSGDLCIFLDADDVLYPKCTMTIGSIWKHGDAKIQYRLDTIDRFGVNQEMPFPHFPRDLTPKIIRQQSYRYGVYPWTVSSGNAFSRALLDVLLPIDSKEIYRSPDGYINKMAPLFGDVAICSEVLGAYRVHGSNAWAQEGGAVRIEPILNWIRFDRVLQSKFEQTARKLDIEVTCGKSVRSLQQMEYILIASRFLPITLQIELKEARPLFLNGIKAAFEAPNTNTIGRAAWILWFSAIAFLPRKIVQLLFRSSRGQSGRNKLSKFLVRFSRGRAQ